MTDVMKLLKKDFPNQERNKAFDSIKEELMDSFTEEELEEQEVLINKYFHKSEKEAIRNLTLGRSSFRRKKNNRYQTNLV